MVGTYVGSIDNFTCRVGPVTNQSLKKTINVLAPPHLNFKEFSVIMNFHPL